MIDRLAVYLLLAGCALFATIIYVELNPGGIADAAITEVPVRADAAAAVQREQRVELDELLKMTLARPLFSTTRRPPQTAVDDAASDPGLPDTRLTGIVTERDHRLAIFAVTGAKPRALTEGETVSGWRVENISPREVSVSGSSGAKILKPRPDPNLVVQPRSPAAINAAARLPAHPAVSASAPPKPGVPPVAALGVQPQPGVPTRVPAVVLPLRPARTDQQR